MTPRIKPVYNRLKQTMATVKAYLAILSSFCSITPNASWFPMLIKRRVIRMNAGISATRGNRITTSTVDSNVY